MSMGMTNLINFDFLCLVFFSFLTFLTNYEYDKKYFRGFCWHGWGGQTKGGRTGEIAQLGLSPCELWNLFEIGLRNKQIKIYTKYN